MLRSKSFTVGAFVFLSFLLSSCISLDADITLNGDAMATGTMKIEMAKQLAVLAGVTSKEGLESLLLENGTIALPEGQPATVSETDTSYIMSVKLVNTPLTDDGLKAEKLANGQVKFTFKNEGADNLNSGFGDFTGTIKITIAFPGSITDASPEFVKVDDRTVMLEASSSDPLDVYVVSNVEKSSSISVGGTSVPLIPLVLGLIILSAIAIGIVRQRKEKSTLPPPHPDESSPIL